MLEHLDPHTVYIKAKDLTMAQAQLEGDWFGSAAPNLADVNAVVAYDFVSIVAAELIEATPLPRLKALSERANHLPAFAQTRWLPASD